MEYEYRARIFDTKVAAYKWCAEMTLLGWVRNDFVYFVGQAISEGMCQMSIRRQV